MRLDPTIIARDIDALIVACPELADDESLRHDMIEGETEAFNLLSLIVRRIGTIKALTESIAAYLKDLGERKSRLERRLDAYRAMARKLMGHANLRKAELAEATLSISAGRQKVIVTDESLLTDAYCSIKREPNKTAIKDALEAGDEVAGAVLSNAEENLTIRTK